MQKKNSPNWVIIGACVFCNAVCAGLWLYRGFFWGDGVDWFYVAVGAIWLLVALLWCVRMMRPAPQERLGRRPGQRAEIEEETTHGLQSPQTPALTLHGATTASPRKKKPFPRSWMRAF